MEDNNKPIPSDICIALLEDDPLVSELITATLDEAGWDYRCFTMIGEIREALKTGHFSLFILDWSLPDGEAFEVIDLIRNHYHLETPILIESLNDDEQQIVKALELGADDYVVKPLRMSEIQARLNALLRRTSKKTQISQIGQYRLEENLNQVFIGEKSQELTVIEFKLMNYLFSHINELLSREKLLADVWHRNSEVDTRTVDAHISRVRKKLELCKENGLVLKSLRGFGYRLEEA
ncbi:MAG: response regulator transcription factor [Gammaproteobacteria bacterium]|jgi:two-component system, OmpR family, response regulator RegX3